MDSFRGSKDILVKDPILILNTSIQTHTLLRINFVNGVNHYVLQSLQITEYSLCIDQAFILCSQIKVVLMFVALHWQAGLHLHFSCLSSFQVFHVSFFQEYARS